MSTVKRLFHVIGSSITAIALTGLWLASTAMNMLTMSMRAGSAGWIVVATLVCAGACIDVLKAGSIVVIHKHWQKHAYWAVGLAGGVWLAASVVAIGSAWNFLAVTITDTTNERSMHGQADTSLRRQLESQENQLIKAEDRKLAAKTDAEAKRADEEIKRIERRLDEQRERIKSERTAGSADPLGEMLSDQFGWPVKKTTFWVIFSFLLAVELCASAGFYLYTPMLFDDEPAKKISPNSPNLEKKPMRVKGKPKLKLVASTDQQRHANRFLAELERLLGPGNSLAQTRLYPLYEKWCGSLKEAPLTPAKLGLALKAIGVDRQGGYYVLPLAKEKPPGSGAPAA